MLCFESCRIKEYFVPFHVVVYLVLLFLEATKVSESSVPTMLERHSACIHTMAMPKLFSAPMVAFQEKRVNSTTNWFRMQLVVLVALQQTLSVSKYQS